VKEGRSLGSMEKVGFGTSVAFDIDGFESPTKRRPPRRKPKRKPPTSKEAACPGCGHEISEKEWLDSLVGFVSGAHNFAVGNPVKARIVQTLKNEVSRISLPNPHEEWELEVVSRLLKEIDRIVAAETRRLQPVLEAELRQKIEAEMWLQFETAWSDRIMAESR